MSTERDELKAIVADALTSPQHGEFALDSTRVAARVLAAGYRKPRQVTTVEELDALPVESIVRDATGFTWDKWWDDDGHEFSWWATTGDRTEYSPKRVNLPATVLYEGTL